jgi:hypothetical protein
MYGSDWKLKVALLAIGVMCVTLALRPYLRPDVQVAADSGRFDSIMIVSVGFLYQGNQGVLLLDKRNGNVWFIGRGNEANMPFKDPVYLARLPLEKLDHAPQ